MATISYFAAAITLCCVVGVHAVQPGFQIGLTNNGLDYVRQIAIPILVPTFIHPLRSSLLVQLYT